MECRMLNKTGETNAHLNVGGNFQSKADQVYEAILSLIINGTLEAEEKFTETEMAAMFGVSRTPVREALRILHAEGFVRLSPNAKFVISGFSKRDAIEVLQIRGLLEGEASKMAARTITEEQKQHLKAVFKKGKNDYLSYKGDAKARAFMESDIAFHRAIFEIAGNQQMLKVSGGLHDRQSRLYVSRNTADTMEQICLTQHQAILDAILEQDEAKAERCAKDHIRFIIQQAVD